MDPLPDPEHELRPVVLPDAQPEPKKRKRKRSRTVPDPDQLETGVEAHIPPDPVLSDRQLRGIFALNNELETKRASGHWSTYTNLEIESVLGQAQSELFRKTHFFE
jgi:hypothetical protein